MTFKMKIYNTKTNKIELFKPLKHNIVKMYVCGITPYDTTHLGHAFTYVFFDTLSRYLFYKGYKVNYVQNVTDVDDSILKKAKETGKNWKSLGDFWTDRYIKDMRYLNIKSPTHFVKATDSIPIMLRIIKVLKEKNIAYTNDGNVYFEVKKFKDYGRLSHLTKDEMIKISKERGADPNDPLKKDPLDFILWQLSKPNEPFWNSKFSKGRPGWHIECSAMIKEYLDDQIDIHGGGNDLIFPHHESEIAQSESYTGKKPFVKYWIHTGMVRYQGKKMAKSLGNLIMVRGLSQKYSVNAIRLLLLSHHYRIPWEYFESEFKEVEQKLSILSKAAKIKTCEQEKKINGMEYSKAIEQKMNNDMDTPNAIDELVRLAKIIIDEYPKRNISSLQKSLKTYLDILGFNL